MDQPTPPHAPPGRHPDDLPPDPDAPRALPRGLMWAGALFVVVLAIASFVALSNDGSTPRADDVVHLDPNAPQPPPALTGADPTGTKVTAATFTTFTGDRTTLAQEAGRPMVINFWASNCTPCIAEMPALESVHQHFGDRVVFIGMDATGDSETNARSLAQTTGVTYALGFDRTGELTRAFGVNTLPATFLIAADGTIVYRHLTQVDAPTLTAMIDEKLAP